MDKLPLPATQCRRVSRQQTRNRLAEMLATVPGATLMPSMPLPEMEAERRHRRLHRGEDYSTAQVEYSDLGLRAKAPSHCAGRDKPGILNDQLRYPPRWPRCIAVDAVDNPLRKRSA